MPVFGSGDDEMTKLNFMKDKDWKDLQKIILFGFGRQGRKMYATLSKDFHIQAIIDNSPNKQGKIFDGLKIMPFQEAHSKFFSSKIIVTTSQYYYKDIRKQLEDAGLQENVDFIMYQQFVTEWYYKYKNKINLLKTDISLTALCTLNCENCMQFLPYWEARHRIENVIDEIKENVDIYFQCVDYVLDLDIVGGEPFLYGHLKEFIQYVGKNYRDQIGYVGFITNGMIIPDDETFALMQKYRFSISISDYSGDILYKHKIPELLAKIKQYNISYMHNKDIDWFDFGFPKQKYNYQGNEAVQHMQCCNSIEHILDDKKLFYCGMEWSAQKGGLFPIEAKAYVDLQQIVAGKADRKEILEMIMANIPEGYLEFCRYCGGFGIDNNNRVKTARQLNKQKEIIEMRDKDEFSSIN
jgi:hypothetical protein